ncbi:hypothetical protein [Marichromatium bheemlicum]|uniref:VCBS repeat-containing protein n=1 Tax=Marichromatium bheemlicum TaxID=365339 RepID=A0ABX1I8A2_9GAMM|nr:hypothetical protein [Marichromatium bheemlicum]NKN33498.1 hypothetical protein [Marichromatium bheemlicum]
MLATRTTLFATEPFPMRPARPLAASTTAPLGISTPPADLAAQVATQVNADHDLQILRKSFDLTTVDHAPADDPPRAIDARAMHGKGRVMNAQVRLAQEQIQRRLTELELSWQSSSALHIDPLPRLDFAQWQGFSMSLQVDATGGVMVRDPLVLDLSGEGIQTTGIEAGVSFDLDADGQAEQVSFATGGTWALALDRNGNGRIDDGRELFGDQNGAAHGFAELARYDDNGDGRIDANDAVFSSLRLLQIGADGSQVQRTLADAAVQSLETGYQHTRKALNAYDVVAQTGEFVREDGSRGELADVLLGYQAKA